MAAPETRGLAVLHAGGVDEMPGGEVVAAIKHDIRLCHQRGEQGGISARDDARDMYFRIDGRNGLCCRQCLGLADARHIMGDLTLQVGEVNHVVIHDGDVAHTGRGQIERCWRPEPASSDDERVRGKPALLNFLTHFIEQYVPRIPQELIICHPAIVASRQRQRE